MKMRRSKLPIVTLSDGYGSEYLFDPDTFRKMENPVKEAIRASSEWTPGTLRTPERIMYLALFDYLIHDLYIKNPMHQHRRLARSFITSSDYNPEYYNFTFGYLCSVLDLNKAKLLKYLRGKALI